MQRSTAFSLLFTTTSLANVLINAFCLARLLSSRSARVSSA
ncbi:MAG: hypothetical protein V3U79_00595 [Dehalococcoidia bacterium]